MALLSELPESLRVRQATAAFVGVVTVDWCLVISRSRSFFLNGPSAHLTPARDGHVVDEGVDEFFEAGSGLGGEDDGLGEHTMAEILGSGGGGGLARGSGVAGPVERAPLARDAAILRGDEGFAACGWSDLPSLTMEQQPPVAGSAQRFRTMAGSFVAYEHRVTIHTLGIEFPAAAVFFARAVVKIA